MRLEVWAPSTFFGPVVGTLRHCSDPRTHAYTFRVQVAVTATPWWFTRVHRELASNSDNTRLNRQHVRGSPCAVASPHNNILQLKIIITPNSFFSLLKSFINFYHSYCVFSNKYILYFVTNFIDHL